MRVAIDIERVTKKFGKDTIIKDISLSIKPGEFFTLLGPSGCGKTTLLRMIIGFNTIESGQIKIDGKIINDVPVHTRNMGMVFQNYAIFPHLSVKENVAFGLKMRNLSPEKIANSIDRILKAVKIDHLQDRMPVKLSGGQQQRVALARAIVTEPEVLLMDEPLSNLDAKLRVEMRNVIKDIQREVGITTVYVTHDQEEALAVSDRIAVMNERKIQQVDTPSRTYRRPANRFVASFIGISNEIEAVVRRQDTENILVFNESYQVPLPKMQDLETGTKVIVAVRPEEFDISEEGPGLPFEILHSVFLGLVTRYFVRFDNGVEAELLQDRSREEIFPEGKRLYASIDADMVNVFDAKTGLTLMKGAGYV